MKTRSFSLSDEVGPPASLTAIPAGSDEAGPDASYARSAIAPLRCGQVTDKYQHRQLGDQMRMSAFGTKQTSRHAQSMSAFGGKADIASKCLISEDPT